jgi:uncharacterized membrane protein
MQRAIPTGRSVERAALILVALAAMAAGIGFRIWHIFAEPLWLDEAYSAFAAGRDFAFLWQVVPRYETHPPFYYTLLHLWEMPFGDGLVALRWLGLAAGLATPPVVGWTTAAIAEGLRWDRQRGTRLVVVAFVFASLSIPLVQMTREVRPYPLMILVYALAIRSLIAIGGDGLRRRPYAGYLLCLALLLWLHTLGIFYAAALVAALLVACRSALRRDWALLIGGHALVALLYLPALLIARDQAPTWIASTWLGFAWPAAWRHLAILYAVPGWQACTAAVLAGLAIVAACAAGADQARLVAMLLILALVPVAASIATTLAITPVFITRTMTPVTVPTLLLLAIGASAWRGRLDWLGWGAAAVLCANLIAVDMQARRRGPMQDWYGTIGWLQRRFRPGDVIVAYPNEAALPMERALRDKGLAWPVRAIPAPVPVFSGGWHPTGSRGVVSLSQSSLHAIAASPAIANIPTVWLLRLSAEAYDRDDVFWHELARDRRMVRRWRDGGIDVIGLTRITPPPAPVPYRR